VLCSLSSPLTLILIELRLAWLFLSFLFVPAPAGMEIIMAIIALVIYGIDKLIEALLGKWKEDPEWI
jgi:hypothetical protein